MSNALWYTYEPLRITSTIRLIKILPEKVNDKVACILYYFDQAEAPPYYALSYVWGDPIPAGCIYLGEHPEIVYPYPLHRNLLEFLRCMWEQERFDNFFWTDSLCLNQKDKYEKAEQVPRMAEIYSNADEVICWLGHEPETEENLRKIQKWPPVVDLGTWDMGNTDEHGFQRPSFRRKGVLPWEKWVQKDIVRLAAKTLLRLPYWSRVWIVQEVALSRKATIACGRTSLDLDTFGDKIREFQGTISQPTIWSLCELRERKGKRPLWQLMRDFHLCRSSLRVDKVYGFLGLVEESVRKTSIEVNYEKSVPEVFWDAMFECDAPWDYYNDVFLWAGFMLERQKPIKLGEHIVDLRRYMNSRWTSIRHIVFAEIVLRVCEAVCAYVRTNKTEGWLRSVTTVLSKTKYPNGAHPELQNAAAVGLVLSIRTEERESSHMFTWRHHAIRDLNWKWEYEQRTDENTGSGETSGQTYVGVKLTTPVPEMVSQSYLAGTTGPINFEIGDKFFKIVASLDTEHEPVNSWRISLDATTPLYQYK